MNIQQNINQTLSVMGMLMSQTPMAEKQRQAKRIELEEDTRTRHKDARQKDLTERYDLIKKELRHERFYESYTDSKTGETKERRKPITEQNVEDVERALKAGETLYNEFPSTELYEELTPYRDYLQRASLDDTYQARLAKSRAKAGFAYQQEMNKLKAKDAAIAEQKRLAATPKIKEDTE